MFTTLRKSLLTCIEQCSKFLHKGDLHFSLKRVHKQIITLQDIRIPLKVSDLMHNQGAAVLEQWPSSTNNMEKALMLKQGNCVLISSFCITSVRTGFRSVFFAELYLSKRDLEKAVVLWVFLNIDVMFCQICQVSARGINQAIWHKEASRPRCA